MLCSVSLSAFANEGAVQSCQQFLRAGEFAKAIDYANQAIKANKDDQMAYLCMGRAAGAAGDHASAIGALQEANQRSTTSYDHMVALTLLGHQQKAIRIYNDARTSYRQALDLARSSKNAHFQRANLMAIGETMVEEGDVKGALDFFQQGMKLAANDNERADSHAHLAAAHSAMHNHDHAIMQQIKAVVMEERSGDLDQYAQASLDLSRYYSDAKQYLDTERTLNKLLEVVKQAGDRYWEAVIYHSQAKLKLAQDKKDEAPALLENAMTISREIGAEDLVKEIEGTRHNM